jgi:hypothetical protein
MIVLVVLIFLFCSLHGTLNIGMIGCVSDAKRIGITVFDNAKQQVVTDDGTPYHSPPKPAPHFRRVYPPVKPHFCSSTRRHRG